MERLALSSGLKGNWRLRFLDLDVPVGDEVSGFPFHSVCLEREGLLIFSAPAFRSLPFSSLHHIYNTDSILQNLPQNPRHSRYRTSRTTSPRSQRRLASTYTIYRLARAIQLLQRQLEYGVLSSYRWYGFRRQHSSRKSLPPPEKSAMRGVIEDSEPAKDVPSFTEKESVPQRAKLSL